MGQAGTSSVDLENEIAKFEAEERARLGLDTAAKSHWTDKMINPFFGAKERSKTTLLVGGLTMAHDYLVTGALTGRGYNVRALTCPDTEALRFGKEFGNRGQCNPTYFTVGNLVKELATLRDKQGMSTADVIDRYVFLTAGACGPCRFGMYVTEYRKALRDAGFDGFRVLLFQQTGGLKQATGDDLGLVLDPPFFISVAKALLSGDVINVMGYRIRPYEVVPGSTNIAIEAVKKEVHTALKDNKSVLAALRRGRKILEGVAVDRSKAKPKVAVLGEFWAMTTEGDGNYHLQRFLESEGGEVDIQMIANLLLYNLWEFRHDTLQRAELRGTDGGNFGLGDKDVGLTMAGLFVGEFVLRSVFHTFAAAIGLKGMHLPDMDEVAKVGHSHYNQELRGGEGHMEVAKLILNVVKQKAHMTLSVKPFGCMPSSGVSDGIQTIVSELYKDAIFCAVETSGDGAVNFYSRVQMFLFKARQRAAEEFERTLKEHGVTAEQVREFLKTSPYGSSLYKAPHRVAGTGADLVHHVAPFIGKGRLGRARVHVTHAKEGALRFKEDLAHHATTLGKAAPYLPSILRFATNEARSALPSPKEAWNKLLHKVVTPTTEEQQAITQSEQAPPPAPLRPAKRPEGQALPVVA